ncbi:type I toxin-antitoxin system Fst family toxin [Enterococcus faecium]
MIDTVRDFILYLKLCNRTICSLLVGLLSALFSYWLNNRNKK